MKEIFTSNDFFVFLSQTKALETIQVFQTFFIRLRKNLICFEAVSSFIKDSESEVGDIGDLSEPLAGSMTSAVTSTIKALALV